MQNKFAIIGIIIAAVLIVGALGIYLFNNNSSKEQAEKTATKIESKKSETEKSSLLSLLQMGETLQCNFNYEDKGNSTAGVVYIDGDRMRSDITTVIDDKDQDFSMIRDRDTNYIWGSAFPEGTGIMMKSSIEDFESNKEYKDYIDFNRDFDFNCKTWGVDESVLTPPSDIEFTNLGGLVGKTIKKETGESACSVCNSLTGAAKDACLQNLDCQN